MKILSRRFIVLSLSIIVIILVNLVSTDLYLSLDLTSGKFFSLSGVSKDLVGNLEEPMTIRVFISQGMKSPYNNLEQDIRDILGEYAKAANRNFNYEVLSIADGEDTDQRSREYIQQAQELGIPQIQIQTLDQDEMSVSSVYMGLAIIHGDLTERIPVLANESNLEYAISNKIQFLKNKISSFAGLSEEITISMHFSPELIPFIQDFEGYVRQYEGLVESLQPRFYSKLRFEYLDQLPADHPIQTQPKLRIPTSEAELNVFADLYIQGPISSNGLKLLQPGIFGDYQILGSDEISERLPAIIERVTGINQNIVFLNAKSSKQLDSEQGQNQNPLDTIGQFQNQLSEFYTLVGEDDLNDGIQAGGNLMIIAGSTGPFTDWELYQIDQFLMAGNSLAIFADAYYEIFNQQSPDPFYFPRTTGLEKLLEHYGLAVQTNYVLDENSPSNRNGQNIYNLIEIQKSNINNEFDFLTALPGLAMYNASPVNILDDTVDAKVLLSSGKNSWLTAEQVDLNPARIRPPFDGKQSYPLAVLREGTVTSYFSGKPIPEPELEEGIDDSVLVQSETIESTEMGKILLLGSSAILSDPLFQVSSDLFRGQSVNPNTSFLLNTIDYLTGNGEMAALRSKTQTINPLRELTKTEKDSFKGINLYMVPVLIVLAGLLSFYLQRRRTAQIAKSFTGKSTTETTGHKEDAE
jgi:ABC-2 type transport system permease protein